MLSKPASEYGNQKKDRDYAYILFLSIKFAVALIIIVSTLIIMNEPNMWKSLNQTIIEYDDRFTINTLGCTIPALDPFDESVARFSFQSFNIEPCPKSNISLLMTDETYIWVITENFIYYNINEEKYFSCCYQSFYRSLLNKTVKYDRCIEFNYVIKYKDEFVRVRCSYKGHVVQEEYFLLAVEIEKPTLGTTKENNNGKLNYSIMIMGIDAVSRLNFYRTMPRTLKYLKMLDAIELQGYNKVGQNTFANMVAMMIGIKYSSLRSKTENDCLIDENEKIDECEFLWKRYKDEGYFTILAEDTYTEIFDFNKIPTDYYVHTFMSEAQKQVGNSMHGNYDLCMGSQYSYKILLNYADNISSKLQSKRFFGIFWEASISHDSDEYPHFMDKDYKKFLKNMYKSNKLNKTVLFMVSDHGMSMSSVQMTKQGSLENRLPFVYMLFPSWFKEYHKNAYNNLILNQRRLTTPFDMYSTLEDLINLSNIDNSNISKRTNLAYGNRRSISLFLPVPNNRTCKMAGIEDHWCTCHIGKKIDVKGKDAAAASYFVVTYLNSLLKYHKNCAQLTLHELLDITEMTVDNIFEELDYWKEYLVLVRTIPGEGIFESTIKQMGPLDNFTVSGTVSRINAYGNQSHCIKDKFLKLYCFCQ